MSKFYKDNVKDSRQLKNNIKKGTFYKARYLMLKIESICIEPSEDDFTRP